MGAKLVSDDQTLLTKADGMIVAAPPAAIAGRIEARGVGILAADFQPTAVVRLVVDMGTEESERIPPLRKANIQGQEIDLVHKAAHTAFAAAIRHYVIAGRIE